VTGPEDVGGVGTPIPHESAQLHVTGEARYIDDLPEPRGTLTRPSARASAPTPDCGTWNSEQCWPSLAL